MHRWPAMTRAGDTRSVFCGEGAGLCPGSPSFMESERTMDILSALAHADVHGLHLLGFEKDSHGPGSMAIDTRPRSDDRQGGMALYLLAQASLQMTRILSLIFDIDVEVPPWVSTEVERIDRETQAEDATE